MDKMTDTDDISSKVLKHSAPYSNRFISSEDESSESEEDKREIYERIQRKLSHRAHRIQKEFEMDQDETARRIAEELLAEEREQKSKAKKKAKKKKRKEKKKSEKESESLKSAKKESACKKASDHSGISEEEDLDPDSAFVAAAANKKKGNYETPNMEADTKKTPIDKEEKKNEKEIKSLSQQAKDVAIRGNEMAKVGEFKKAASLFTEAIKLDPVDYRFHGNRSYCYELDKLYEKALRDAEIVIGMAPMWPKGYFRKGRALIGLARYSEAEEAFEQVIKRDKNCSDAMQELKKVRMLQITDMGFTETQAEDAIEKHGNIEGALESLLGSFVDPKSRKSKTCPSPVKRVNPPIRAEPKSTQKQCTSVWVGNVLPDVSETDLAMLFSRCGPVQSVKVIPEKYCAFVDYKDVGYVEKAIANLQGHELMGQRLSVRYPEKSVVFSGPQHTPIVRKGTLTRISEPTPRQSSSTVESKKNGPVNGNECYYWRTTGCAYGAYCRNSHVPENKGVDRKPWHRLPAYSS